MSSDSLWYCSIYILFYMLRANVVKPRAPPWKAEAEPMLKTADKCLAKPAYADSEYTERLPRI